MLSDLMMPTNQGEEKCDAVKFSFQSRSSLLVALE
jgi:hypothetical protein